MSMMSAKLCNYAAQLVAGRAADRKWRHTQSSSSEWGVFAARLWPVPSHLRLLYRHSESDRGLAKSVIGPAAPACTGPPLKRLLSRWQLLTGVSPPTVLGRTAGHFVTHLNTPVVTAAGAVMRLTEAGPYATSLVTSSPM